MRRFLVLLAAALPLVCFGATAGPADTGNIADAVMNGDMGRVRSLIAQKADVNAAQSDGATGLHWAAHKDNIEAADLLLKAGASPKVFNRLKATPLYLAAENGNAAMIKRLLAAGADVNEPILTHNETALMYAAKSGNAESVRLLLDAGARTEEKEKLRGTTALLWAAEQNHAEVVSLLLARGAKSDAQSTIIRPPARRPAPRPAPAAAASGAPAAAAEPVADDDAPPPPAARGGVTALALAVREEAIDTIKALIAGGAPINQQTADGSTALLVALQNGNAQVARLLIDHGADVKIVNAKGWNPLYLAIKARTMEQGTMPNPMVDKVAMFDVIREIVDHGADINARLKADTEIHNAIAATWLREAGATPFLRAALCGDVEVMKLLLAHGADPKISTTDGTTTLMALSGVGYAEGFMHDFGTPEESLAAMKMLLDFGIDVNAKNTDGVIAIHGAAHKNFLRGIQLLVDNGADLTIRSHRVSNFERKGSPGNTALDWATGVQIGMQSSIYHADAVELVTKLMTERNIPIVGLSQTKGGNAITVKSSNANKIRQTPSKQSDQ